MNQGNAQFQMTGCQQLVRRSLTDKSEPVALLYECALRVLGDESNAGRVMLAAHSVREMMNGLPKVLELPVLAEQGEPVFRVQRAQAAVSRCISSNTIFTAGGGQTARVLNASTMGSRRPTWDPRKMTFQLRNRCVDSPFRTRGG